MLWPGVVGKIMIAEKLPNMIAPERESKLTGSPK